MTGSQHYPAFPRLTLHRTALWNTHQQKPPATSAHKNTSKTFLNSQVPLSLRCQTLTPGHCPQGCPNSRTEALIRTVPRCFRMPLPPHLYHQPAPTCISRPNPKLWLHIINTFHHHPVVGTLCHRSFTAWPTTSNHSNTFRCLIFKSTRHPRTTKGLGSFFGLLLGCIHYFFVSLFGKAHDRTKTTAESDLLVEVLRKSENITLDGVCEGFSFVSKRFI